MKINVVIVLALFLFLWPQLVAFAQSTSPDFNYEEEYQFPEKYEAYKSKKDKSATVFGKELFVGKFGNDGYFAITRDDGAYDYSRPEDYSPNNNVRLRLKLPF